MKTAHVGILLSDRRMRGLYANDRARHLLSLQDGRGPRQWLDAFDPHQRPNVERLVRRCIAEGAPGSIRHRIPVHGAPRWVEHGVAPLRAADGGIAGAVSTLTDVTDEQEAVERLADSREFIEAILDVVDALVVVMAADGTILGFNAACERASGLRAEDVLGRSLLETLIPPDQQDMVAGVFAHLVAGTAGDMAENDWMTADGGRRRISWTNTTLPNADGSVRAVISTGIDVTDERMLEATVAQSERLDSIGRLAAGIAHDFNNTLTTLQVRLERLTERHHDKASRADIAAMQRTMERTAKVVRDLTSFGDWQELTLTELDVNSEVSRLTALLRDLLGEAIAIELDLTDQDTSTVTDAARFEQVVTNLVLNARDAMPDGGVLRLATRVETITKATRHAASPHLTEGPYVRLDVIDTGHGIEPVDLAHVFEPYFTTKRPQGGSGLGLATSYRTITQSGGAMVADSRPGAGTTLSVWLPHRPSPSA